MSYKSKLLTFLMASGSLISSAAQAATTVGAAPADPGHAATTERTATDIAAEPVPTNATEPGMEEIVVTAQKRKERLVNVPIAVVAISGAGLEKSGVTNLRSLSQVVPAMHIDAIGAAFQPSIRGIGTAIAGNGASSNVATYIDGIYQPSPYGTDFSFIDIENIQVSKGPQGTLFGRNATGGAISVTTKSPSFTPHADIKAGFGSFNTAEVGAFLTGGVTDKIAASLAIGVSHSDGWLHNTALDRNGNPSQHFLARLKILAEVTDWWKATVTFLSSRDSDPTLGSGSAWNGYSDDVLFVGKFPIISGNNNSEINITEPVYSIANQRGVNLKNEWDIGFANLTSYSSVHWVHFHGSANELNAPTPPDGTALKPGAPASIITLGDIQQREETYTQEFDLNSEPNSGPVDWVVGLFYFYDDTHYDPFSLEFYGPFGPGRSKARSALIKFSKNGAVAISKAAFGDATYNLGDFHFTAGGRYEIDRALEYNTSYFPAFVPYQSRGTDFYSFTPRLVVRYSITPDSNIYVSWSKGTKAGIYNTNSFLSQKTPIAPEKLTDIEAGYKIAAPTWRFEASLFHYDYRNLQVATFVGASAITQNAQSAEIVGGDVTYEQDLPYDLNLSFGAAYTHARYRRFSNAVVQGFSFTSGVTTGAADVAGKEMERTPAFSGNVGLDWTHTVLGGTLNLYGSYSYRTLVYFDFANTQKQKAYGLLNLRAAWTDPGEHWTFSLSGNNVLNQTYLTEVLFAASGAQQSFGQPASVMAEVNYRF